jgi:8-oxo-dGTP diphosphatase
MTAKFCPQCGTSFRRRKVFRRRRPVCPECGYVWWDDPKVGVGVVAEHEGEILLVRRNHEPHTGCWSFPSGYLDAGEPVEEAATREAREETGLEVALERLLGVYSQAGERTVFIAFAGRVVGGELTPGDECLETRFFSPDELPEMAFPHDPLILEAWRAGQA